MRGKSSRLPLKKLWLSIALCLLLVYYILLELLADGAVSMREDGTLADTEAAILGYYLAPERLLREITSAYTFYATINDVTLNPWPNKTHLEDNDRMVSQLHYVPVGYKPHQQSKLIAYPFEDAAVKSATKRLASEECPVRDCVFSASRSDVMRADAVILKGQYQMASLAELRHPRQVWIMYQLESPHHAPDFSSIATIINWTATYRRDSVLVTPYEKFVAFSNQTRLPDEPVVDYVRNKSRLVAWFVSNCGARNGRGEYVAELQKHIQVDVYGQCGDYHCPRSDSGCFTMLAEQYKFYLSFENSNCKDYITEKLFFNAYQNDVVPIVMGAHPDDYAAVAPPSSYIHVDDFRSPKHLAKYLLYVNHNDDLYNSYFRWRGTGEFINTKFWCRVCSMVHGASANPFWYSNVNRWWLGPDVCTRPKDNNGKWSSWRTRKRNLGNLLAAQFDKKPKRGA